ncbi:MAG: L-histidine N(alpha)-methyltransferase [Mesorhizobium sp.]|nr:MAG: L-histidine N(alpha)-methyltransferase [Mesorhizobium sp.]
MSSLEEEERSDMDSSGLHGAERRLETPRFRIIGDDVPDTALFCGERLLKDISKSPRTINSMYYYDDLGSVLFERLCQEPSYYLFRTEHDIISRHGINIAETTGPASLIELGCGNGQKTKMLLEAYSVAQGEITYVPIDINRYILDKAGKQLICNLPNVSVLGIVGTYETAMTQLPNIVGRKLIMCLGSTMGNMEDEEISALLETVRSVVSQGDYFLVGIDRDKDSMLLEAAYNNQTAIMTNLAVLRHINWRFEGDFDMFQFRHVAFHNVSLGRMESYLESLATQTINLKKLNFSVTINCGERIMTEIMRKVKLESFNELFRRFGFTAVKQWSDMNRYFAVCLFRAE